MGNGPGSLAAGRAGVGGNGEAIEPAPRSTRGTAARLAARAGQGHQDAREGLASVPGRATGYRAS